MKFRHHQVRFKYDQGVKQAFSSFRRDRVKIEYERTKRERESELRKGWCDGKALISYTSISNPYCNLMPFH